MPHEYQASVNGSAVTRSFTDQRYSRWHQWSFDEGITVRPRRRRSACVCLTRLPKRRSEEALVAALANCHMLTFLYVAAKQGFVVDDHADEAVGEMTKNERGKLWVSKVALSPRITFTGDKRPTPQQLDELHHLAHEECYIANSVKSEVIVQGACHLRSGR